MTQISTISKLSFIIITLLILCTLQCSAIKCYSCNSYDDLACGDPFQSFGEDSRAYIDCDSLKDGRNYTFCRKTIQTGKIYQCFGVASLRPDMDTVRVIRRCGYIPDPKLEPEQGDDPAELKCYRRTGTYAVELLFCGCHADGCNSANSLFTVSTSLLLSCLVMVARRI